MCSSQSMRIRCFLFRYSSLSVLSTFKHLGNALQSNRSLSLALAVYTCKIHWMVSGEIDRYAVWVCVDVMPELQIDNNTDDCLAGTINSFSQVCFMGEAINAYNNAYTTNWFGDVLPAFAAHMKKCEIESSQKLIIETKAYIIVDKCLLWVFISQEKVVACCFFCWCDIVRYTQVWSTRPPKIIIG